MLYSMCRCTGMHRHIISTLCFSALLQQGQGALANFAQGESLLPENISINFSYIQVYPPIFIAAEHAAEDRSRRCARTVSI